MSSYRTVKNTAEAEIIEKKSRFIAHVSPVGSESGAAEFIAGIKKKHYNANHNVFAYTLGLKGETVKQSDDGEPSGTAGMPVLDLLRKQGIYNCVIVVTRYFGGTLLGTGGLVRAYSKAAKEGLAAAIVIERAEFMEYGLTIDYSTFGKVEYEFEKQNLRIVDKIYSENVTIKLLIETEKNDEFIKTVSKLCQGRETLEFQGKNYYDIEIPLKERLYAE